MCSITTPDPANSKISRYLSPRNLAWVQLCDVSGTPRELAGDGDRIFPGRGRLSSSGRSIEHLGGLATTAMSRWRSSIRISGRSPPIAWPTWAVRLFCRVLDACETTPAGSKGGS